MSDSSDNGANRSICGVSREFLPLTKATRRLFSIIMTNFSDSEGRVEDLTPIGSTDPFPIKAIEGDRDVRQFPTTISYIFGPKEKDGDDEKRIITFEKKTTGDDPSLKDKYVIKSLSSPKEDKAITYTTLSSSDLVHLNDIAPAVKKAVPDEDIYPVYREHHCELLFGAPTWYYYENKQGTNGYRIGVPLHPAPDTVVVEKRMYPL